MGVINQSNGVHTSGFMEKWNRAGTSSLTRWSIILKLQIKQNQWNLLLLCCGNFDSTSLFLRHPQILLLRRRKPCSCSTRQCVVKKGLVFPDQLLTIFELYLSNVKPIRILIYISRILIHFYKNINIYIF